MTRSSRYARSRKGQASLGLLRTCAIPITGEPVEGEHKFEYGCPGLGKIPYVSRLFLNNGNAKTKTECLLLITPRIIIQEEE